MFIHTFDNLIPGKCYYNNNYIYDGNLNIHYDIGMKVIRECTKEEFIEFVQQEGFYQNLDLSILDGCKYYEISID